MENFEEILVVPPDFPFNYYERVHACVDESATLANCNVRVARGQLALCMKCDACKDPRQKGESLSSYLDRTELDG